MSGPSVLVLAGGLSHERDVSLRSGRRVAEALRGTGIEVTVHDVDNDLLPALAQIKPSIVWPLLHGASGEDGSVRDILELVGQPYIGADPRASRVSWSKPIAKTMVGRAGIATPRFVTLPQSLFRELGASRVLDSIVSNLGMPLVVKPARGGSALGVTVVTEASALPRAMVDAYAYGETAIIEQAVSGTEVAVSVVDTGNGPVVLPAVEIVPREGPYDYDARYVPGRVEYFAPARLDAQVAARVEAAALGVHESLGLRHLSRTDLIVSDDGVPQFIDINTAPGMTETSLLPQAAEAAGFELGDLYRAIVDGALA
ncbi:MAG: D-alanine--D-alanine ligase [Actinomycetota bacterium]|nr:D-alanine--D-alanine ligase [Actinomycetota bacterium]